MIVIALKCHKHPRYQGIKLPSAVVGVGQCPGCTSVFHARRIFNNHNKSMAMRESRASSMIGTLPWTRSKLLNA
jgi:hypothetical protein